MSARVAIARRRQRGFTLVELLVTMVVGSVLGAITLAFFTSGLDSATSRVSQADAQDAARLAIERFARDVRQATSPDGGTQPPILSATSTAVELYVDTRRSATATTPSPSRVRYQLSGTELVRQVDAGTGYGSPEVLAEPVQNGSTPIFSAFDASGAALGSPVISPAGVRGFTVELLVGQRNGATSTTTRLRSEVALRNVRE